MRPLLALAVGLVLLLAPSAHAAPAWLPAAPIPGEGTRAREPQLAFGPDGTLVAVWREGAVAAQTINAAARPPGGPVGPAEDVPRPPGENVNSAVTVAFDAQGNALAA